MPGLDQDNHSTHVQGGLREGGFINGQYTMLCAGPPFLEDLGNTSIATADGSVDVVFPIGLVQNITLSQNKAVSRLFEIGSDRSYFITGRTVGQLTMFRPMYHGPSLLRCLYAYYSSDGGATGVPIEPIFQSPGAINPSNSPFTAGPGVSAVEGSGTKAQVTGKLRDIQIPPGHDNFFINLASDLFSQPIGLLLVMKDNSDNGYGYLYLENCRIPNHTMATDAQGLIYQESVGVQYERIVPIKVNQVKLLDKVLPDIQGASSF